MTRRFGSVVCSRRCFRSPAGISGQDRAGTSTPAFARQRRLAALHRATCAARKYSPLDQINAANFSKLEVAWRFKTDSLGPRPEYKLEGTPLDGQRRALHDRRHAALGRRARRQDRRADLGAQPARRQARRRLRRASCRAAACRTGPTAAATIASSTSRPATAWSRSTRRPARRSARFGTDGIVDLKVGAVFGAGQQIDLETGEIGVHSTPAIVEGRRHRRLVVPRRRDRQHAQQHQGPGARVRRAHRQAALDVQHDSAARRVRQRHVGERLVGRQRQHRRLDADHRRRGARPRLSAGRDADVGLLRRPSARQQPVRREPRLRRSEDRPAQVALPVRAPSALELRHVVGADPRRHHRERPRDQGGRGAGQAGRSCTSSIASPASRCGRSKSGRCRSATCPARRPARRSRSRPSRRPTRATSSRCRTI